jgi:pimeloyl-ACP methyl ester carboxylesterase
METGRAQGSTLGKARGHGIMRNLAGLAADDYGESDARAPLVLLHGLTFDRSLWRPALAELRRIDPGRRVLALDLPGHGESPDWSSYDIESVAHGVYRAVEEAQVQAPVIVGHSIAAVIATVYAARHPTRGIVNVDQSLQVAPFARLVQSLADKLRGPAFPAVWQMFAASMHIELLPESAQRLVRASGHPRQDFVRSGRQEQARQGREELLAGRQDRPRLVPRQVDADRPRHLHLRDSSQGPGRQQAEQGGSRESGRQVRAGTGDV